jgi:hypothetical protein
MSIPKLEAFRDEADVRSRRTPILLRPARRSSVELGVRVAWWLVAAGMLLGAVVGLWSFGEPFPAPKGFESYSDVPRRLVRLAHIAMIALPVLYLEYVRHAERATPRWRELGSRLMLVGMTLLPATLAAAAFVPSLLYALPLPVTCLLSAVLVLAVQLTRREDSGAS